MHSRLYLNDLGLNLLLVLALLLLQIVFILSWSFSSSSSSLQIHCWAFASQWSASSFLLHLFHRSPWSSPLSASFTQSSSSRLTHFSSASFRTASIWVSRARLLTWAAACLCLCLCLCLFTPLIFFLQELPDLFQAPFTAVQLLWVVKSCWEALIFSFWGWRLCKKDSCSWTPSSCVSKSLQKWTTLSRCFPKTRDGVEGNLWFYPFYRSSPWSVKDLLSIPYVAHSRAVFSAASYILLPLLFFFFFHNNSSLLEPA